MAAKTKKQLLRKYIPANLVERSLQKKATYVLQSHRKKLFIVIFVEQ